MNNVEYMISSDDKEILTENITDVVNDVKNESITQEELKDIYRLLQINESNFKELSASTWFKKSWLIISGKRGKLTSISISNLGQIQLGVLKLIGELLQDNSNIKKDLLRVFFELEKIKIDSIQLKTIILKFNENYKDKFVQIQKEISGIKSSLRATQLISGVVFLAAAILLFAPGLKELYWQFGAGGIAMAGFLLIYQATKRIKGIKRKDVIPLNKKERVTIQKLNSDINPDTVEFLGLKSKKTISKQDNRIFKIDKGSTDILSYFKLSAEEQRLLFSLQYSSCLSDIDKTSDNEKKQLKGEWLEAWNSIINSQMQSPIVTSQKELQTGLNEVAKEKLPIVKLGIILFEVSLFTPYYNLGTSKPDDKLIVEPDQSEKIKYFCKILGVPMHFIRESLENNEKALKEISKIGLFENIWNVIKANPYKVLAGSILTAITGGLAAPLIGGLVGGALGLSGAAAVNAGLAFLGGGAIAAGGLGMVGGTAVLIGGGAIIGVAATSSMINLFSSDSNILLRELAKMESILKVFFVSQPNAKEISEKVLEEQKITLKKLEAKRLSLNSNVKAEIRKEAEESIRYCKKAIERIEDWINEKYS